MQDIPSLSSPQFWLLSVTASFIAIHLSLTWRTDSPSFLGISLLFWLSAVSLVWKERQTLSLKTGIGSSLLGATILTLLLLKSTAITGGHFVRCYPFMTALGLGLLASGFQGLKQYWQALIILFFLGVPEVVLLSLTNFSEATARFSNAMLWYAGFDVVRQGVHIYLPGGGVEVYGGCSGMQLMMQLLGLAVLVLVLLPLRWHWMQILGLPIIAMVIAFVVNGLRVSLMAILIAEGKKSAFDYWHMGNGSLIFSGIAVLLFILVVQGVLRYHLTLNPENQD